MKKILVFVVALIVVFTLAACTTGGGATDNGGATTDNSGGGAATTDTGNGAATTTGVNYATDVGIVLPTNAESRWPAAEVQFNKSMPGATVLYSNGDTAVEKTNVESLIAKGVKYIIICSQDGTVASSSIDAAKAAGITTIAYDRLIMDTANLDYYVTFDSVAVGAAQGQYLADQATGTGNNLYLYAGALSDNNSFLFFQGAWSVLQPKIADGTFNIVNSSEATALKDQAELSHDDMSKIIGQITTNWDASVAKTLAESNLGAASAAQKGTAFVLAPNDDCSRAITDAFRNDSAVTQIYSTGQDFTQASLQYILDGKQSMTIFKSDALLVAACLDIVNSVAAGTTPTSIVTTYNNLAADIPATKCDLATVTKDNIADIVSGSGLFQISNGQVAPL